MIRRQNFKLPLGKHLTVRIKLTVPTTVSMAAATAVWRLGTVEDAQGADVKITKQTPASATLQQDANSRWEIVFELAPADMGDLEASVAYFSQADVTLANGRTYPANKGMVTTEPMM